MRLRRGTGTIAVLVVVAVSGCSSGRSSPAPTVDASARVGDGFCEPALSGAGYAIHIADSAQPRHRSDEAIKVASNGPLSDYAHMSAYFAAVVNPTADKLNLGSQTSSRTTWVIEATQPRPAAARDPNNKGPGPAGPASPRAVGFVDDETLQSAGAWAAC